MSLQYSGGVRSLGLFVFFVLVLVACGGSDAGEPAASADAQPVEVPAVVTVASPLEERLGFASEPSRRQYQLITLQQEADQSIVQCMRQAGFFYAVGSAESRFRSGAFASDGSREWTSANGLGITSSFIDAIVTEAGQAVADPAATNLDYVASLTTEQAVDYDRALVGEIVAPDITGEYQPAGCWGASFTDIVDLLTLVDEFEEDLATMNSRLDADPRATNLKLGWPDCMANAGYRYRDAQAMVDDIYARLLEIELVESNGIVAVASRENLDALVEYERQVAGANFDCRQGFAADLDELRFDYEREFLDDNRFRIAELLEPSP